MDANGFPFQRHLTIGDGLTALQVTHLLVSIVVVATTLRTLRKFDVALSNEQICNDRRGLGCFDLEQYVKKYFARLYSQSLGFDRTVSERCLHLELFVLYFDLFERT